jgi:hypothetical protein
MIYVSTKHFIRAQSNIKISHHSILSTIRNAKGPNHEEILNSVSVE